jgi:serine O-acetyltransferase
MVGMEHRPPPHPPLDGLVADLVASYHADPRTHHLNSTFLPNRDRTIQIIELLRQVTFPGFFDERKLTTKTVESHTAVLLADLFDRLYQQVREAIRYAENKHRGTGDTGTCDQEAQRIALEFLGRLPELRRKLALDVQAGYDGDPAAASTDEVVFCYPGFDAIFIHRAAHELWQLQVPLLPRLMTEYAHNETGIDIHPGATVGESFFIDHGTGVVIGETTDIGKRVKVYQGVTLGALSTKGGQSWRGRKRHPTIEDDVTIYGGAIILGGETVIGRGSTIGGTVFLTTSVPPGSMVSMKQPELKVSNKSTRGKPHLAPDHLPGADYQI